VATGENPFMLERVSSSSSAEKLGQQFPYFQKGGTTMAIRSETAKAGIGFGSALAITISWSTHKSILWAILHGILSWFYVIYYAIVR
jgi:hypothetical protein